MADVRNARRDVTTRLEEVGKPAQHAPRIGQMLEHVAAEDAVEMLTTELVKHRRGVADEHAVELARSLRRHRLVQLDPDDARPRSRPLERGAELAGRAADVEERAARLGNDPREIAAGPGVGLLELRHCGEILEPLWHSTARLSF